MDVKPGYKQTEVGVIPDDWDLTPLLELIDASRSIRYGIVQPGKFDPSGRCMVRGQDYSTGWVDPSELFRVSPQVEEPFKNARVKAGDVIITIVGASTGHIEVIPNWLDGANLTQTTARLAIHPAKAFSGFCKCYLQSAAGQRQVANYLKGAAQPGLNCGDIEKFRIPLPPTLPEQRAIAEALSDVDGLLSGLDRLIAKKRDLKQAAMQQLLTGQTRLPGFHGEWAMRPLATLAERIMVGIASAATHAYRTKGVPMFRNQNIKPGYLDDGDLLFVDPEYEFIFRNKRLRDGDLLTARTGYPGTTGVVPSRYESAQSFTTLITRPKQTEIQSNYLCCYINSEAGQRFFTQSQIGGAQKNVNAGTLRKMPIPVPSLPEQTAIAEVLSDVDAELAALEQRREKTRALKQAMMQELLTGKTRLVSSITNVISIPKPEKIAGATTLSHNWQINEAVIIGVLAKQFGTESWPLPRKRRVKLTYLLHRHAEGKAEGYLKKAAGPYNPGTKYKGPEAIALKNGYVREHNNGTYSGFVAAGKVAQAEEYFAEWYPKASAWLEQFRFEKTDELELLSTVDMAMEDLRLCGRAVDLGTVKDVIRNHPEWEAKLSRPIFSDNNIARAINTCERLFMS